MSEVPYQPLESVQFPNGACFTMTELTEEGVTVTEEERGEAVLTISQKVSEEEKRSLQPVVQTQEISWSRLH